MIIDRQRIQPRSQLYIECMKNVFHIAFQVVKVKLAFRVMDAFRSENACGGHNQGSAFPAISINLAEFVELDITDSAVCIPLNSPQHTWNERSPQNSFIVRHRIRQSYRF